MKEKAISGKIDTPSCIIENMPEPCGIIIFGASGDLTGRKIVPALFRLYSHGIFQKGSFILGCARTDMDTDGFRDRMKSHLRNHPDFEEEKWNNFANILYYHPLHYQDKISFMSLKDILLELDKRHGIKGNHLFYLAVPPQIYMPIIEQLGINGLSRENREKDGWTRIVVEKPFGHDLQSALELDRILHRHFKEHQIFRIDHYLAKETVQSILMFRFANAIFEPIWNRRYIEAIKISALESIGVEHRSGYYEQAGVIRDMFQNHMMQLLALTAMEPPAEFKADRVRDEKVKVYRALRPFPVHDLNSYIVLGQYQRGEVGGKEVIGYREEPGVNPDSLTPTFASMKVFVDNWRWQGVPFYLSSGKRLSKKLTQIEILFKHVPHSMFRHVIDESIEQNRLTFCIYPEEKISLRFQIKRPAAKVCLRSVAMDFHYLEDYTGPIFDAYEKVLLDCILGDQMLFWRQDGVEQCWSFLTPILEACETCSDRAQRLHFYPAGSWGPEQSISWLAID